MATQRMRKQKSRTVRGEDFFASAIDLAGEAPWAEVTIWDVAQKAGGTVAEFHRFFPDKAAILVAYSRKLDEEVAAVFPDSAADVSVRDRLFDVLMERLEAANRSRAASLSFLRSVSCDPQQVAAGTICLAESVERMLEVAGIDASGFSGRVRVGALTLGYVSVLRVWARDEGPDLGKTMAALDQMLSRCAAYAF